MKVVIDIDEELYEYIKSEKYDGHLDKRFDYMSRFAIKNGIPLPKGHGRLIDADELKTHVVGTELGTDLEVYLEPTIINAPTIIEADIEKS